LIVRRHFPVLDGLRGLAIIAVLFKHSAYVFEAHGYGSRWFLPILEFGGWGVDLFFVLSGFLITGILLDTRNALNRGTSFYGRRILRIFPVYYLALGLILLLQPYSAWVRTAANIQGLTDHLAYLFYFQNWIPLWHHGNYPESFIGHFWSLAVEEQFYMIWPVIVWHLSARAVTKLCAAALFVTVVLRIALVTHFGNGIWVYAFTITRADGLFVGAAIAAIYAVKGQISRRLLAGTTAAGAGALAIVAVIGPARQLWQTGTAMAMIGIFGIAVLSGALIVFCMEFNQTAVATFFKQRWIRTFGKYSYGMYVWHFPIFYGMEHLLKARSVVFPLPTALAFPYVGLLILLTYAFAWISFNGYEQWFLRLKTRFEPVFAEQDEPKAAPAQLQAT
jgi:peptidoglycan/LPS O-acetylase OafA/YrhL